MAFQRAKGTPRSLNGAGISIGGDAPSSPFSPYGASFSATQQPQSTQAATDALERARAGLEAAMLKDRKLPELQELIGLGAHSAVGVNSTYIKEGPRSVQISPIIPLPEALLEQYDRILIFEVIVQCSFVGLFFRQVLFEKGCVTRTHKHRETYTHAYTHTHTHIY
eukprot:Opistho-2@66473